MKGRFIIPGRLPGLNEYIAAEREHRQRGARLKRACEDMICYEIARQLRGVRFVSPVRMRYLWVEKNRRRDKDNISSMGRKLIQDALVRQKVLANDGWENISGFSDCFAVDGKRPRIEVEIDDETD